MLTVVKIFQVQPGLQEIFRCHTSGNWNMRRIGNIFLHHLFKNILDEVFVDDVEIYRAVWSVMKKIQVFKKDVKGLEVHSLRFYESNDLIKMFLVIEFE